MTEDEAYKMCIRDRIGAYDITADELLAGTDTAKTESKTAQAQMIILELLADGKRMPSADVYKKQESDFLLDVPDNGIGGFDPAVELSLFGADTFLLHCPDGCAFMDSGK